MPHVVVEHSDNLTNAMQGLQLLPALYKVMVASELFSPQAIKVRSSAFREDCYVLPEGVDRFAHINAAILAGRDLDKREKLADALFACAKEILPEGAMISVNIHEMEAATYRK
jgi:5-carboxymethyl-2-hydroxymuconate isomerase